MNWYRHTCVPQGDGEGDKAGGSLHARSVLSRDVTVTSMIKRFLKKSACSCNYAKHCKEPFLMRYILILVTWLSCHMFWSCDSCGWNVTGMGHVT